MGSTPLSPEFQEVLQQLFELFSSYIATSRSAERSRLQAQILDLFARLGVAETNPLVRQAADFFETIRVDEPVALSRQAILVNQARRLVDTEIRQFERGTQLTLTSGARQLLRTPVAEAIEFTERFDRNEISDSLAKLFETLTSPPEIPSEGTARSRTAIAVIRAYWRNFCNIPPFCAGRHE
jgi:hypothetical protein